MRVLQRRPDRDHVHARELLTDDAGLQARMDRLDLGLLMEHVLEDLLRLLQQLGAHVRLPARIRSTLGDRRARETRDRMDAVSHVLQLRLHGTA